MRMRGGGAFKPVVSSTPGSHFSSFISRPPKRAQRTGASAFSLGGFSVEMEAARFFACEFQKRRRETEADCEPNPA